MLTDSSVIFRRRANGRALVAFSQPLMHACVCSVSVCKCV